MRKIAKILVIAAIAAVSFVSCTTVNERLDILDAKVTELELAHVNDATAISDKVTELENVVIPAVNAVIDEVKSNVEVNADAIDGLNTTVGSLVTNLADLSNTTDNAVSDIEGLKNITEDLNTALSNTTERVSTVEGAVSTLTTDVEALKSLSEEYGKALTDLEAAYKAADTQVYNDAKAYADGIDNKLTAVLTETNLALTALDTKYGSEVSRLEGLVATAKKEVSDLLSDVVTALGVRIQKLTFVPQYAAGNYANVVVPVSQYRIHMPDTIITTGGKLALVFDVQPAEAATIATVKNTTLKVCKMNTGVWTRAFVDELVFTPDAVSADGPQIKVEFTITAEQFKAMEESHYNYAMALAVDEPIMVNNIDLGNHASSEYILVTGRNFKYKDMYYDLYNGTEYVSGGTFTDLAWTNYADSPVSVLGEWKPVFKVVTYDASDTVNRMSLEEAAALFGKDVEELTPAAEVSVNEFNGAYYVVNKDGYNSTVGINPDNIDTATKAKALTDDTDPRPNVDVVFTIGGKEILNIHGEPVKYSTSFRVVNPEE